MESIQPGKFVALSYEVFTIDEDGEASMYKFSKEHPDTFIFGVEQGIIDGFAKKLTGLKPGDEFNFTLAPEEAFGERDPEAEMMLEKTIFVNKEGVFDAEKVFEGAVVPMMTADGYRVQGIVLEVTDDKVRVDFNHPFAGASVKYVGSVLEVRDATQEELNPHHGHSCGCGCDHDHDHGSCGGGCEGCSGCH